MNRSPRIAALVAIALISLAGLSFYAGQSIGGSPKVITETSVSSYTQTSTSLLTSTVTMLANPPSQGTVTTTTTSTALTTITGTITSTSISTTTVTTTASTTGNTGLSGSIPTKASLLLTLSLNATSIQSGKGVSIGVSMTNMLSTSNNVTSAASWPLNGLSENGCGTTIYPMGIEVIRGTNLSAASSNYLDLFYPGPHSCPAGPYQVSWYQFKNGSQIAHVSSVSFPPYFLMNATMSFGGYWTWDRTVDPSANPVFHPFEPGVYTVVAGDEWGDVVLLHFTVA